MDSPKTTQKKSINAKPKPSNSNANITKQSVKDLESQAKQSPGSSKRGPKRKLQVQIESNVKRSCLRSNKEKVHSANAQRTSAKKAKEKSSKVDTAGEESSDDTFTEEEDEDSILQDVRDDDKATSKNNVNTKSHLNGDKNPVFYTSPRVRKPNPKFQDFITSPKVRSITNEKQTKEKPETLKIKIKPKVKSSPAVAVPVEKDPLDIVNMKPDSDGKEDDIVRSFLPIMDKPKVLYNLDEEAFGIVKSSKSRLSSAKVDNAVSPIVKETETKTDNENSKNAAKPDISDKITTPADVTPLTTTASVTPVITTPEDVTPNSGVVIPVSNTNATESKVKMNATNNANHQKKANNHNVRKYTRTPIDRKKKSTLIDTKRKEEIRYCLIDGEGVSYRTKSPKTSDVDFNKLVRTLKSVKLPASNWKIRIVVSRQQTITEVTFTNKEVNERCVKFSRVFTGYVITFGKSVVKLVGAPNKISSFNDVTILLDIIHNLSLSDPILQYVSDKDK